MHFSLSKHSYSFHIVCFRLQIKSTATPRDSAMFCYQKSFKDLLIDNTLKDGQVDLMLVIINNALMADNSLGSLLDSLKSTLLEDPANFLGQVGNSLYDH